MSVSDENHAKIINESALIADACLGQAAFAHVILDMHFKKFDALGGGQDRVKMLRLEADTGLGGEGHPGYSGIEA